MEMIGFYREMEPENQDIFHESIRDKVRNQASYPKPEIKKYLESGYPILDVTEMTLDVIEGSFRVPGGSSLLSDGRFVWRVDLPVYVGRYNIELPREFISFVIENKFSVPPASRQTLLTVSTAAGRALGFRVDSGAEPNTSA